MSIYPKSGANVARCDLEVFPGLPAGERVFEWEDVDPPAATELRIGESSWSGATAGQKVTFELPDLSALVGLEWVLVDTDADAPVVAGEVVRWADGAVPPTAPAVKVVVGAGAATLVRSVPGPQGAQGVRGLDGDAGTFPPTVPSFVDDFSNRAEGEPLDSARWVDLKSVHPDSYEPLAHRGGGVGLLDATTRPGTYDSHPPSGAPPTGGRIHWGIGGAYRDLGSVAARVKVTWNGHVGEDNDHIEGAPMVHVTPESDLIGFGAWPASLSSGAVKFLIAGSITNPPEAAGPNIVGTRTFTHTEGTDREIEITTDGSVMRVWLDGTELTTGWTCPYPIAVPAELQHSTRHGFALDAHWASESNATSLPGIYDVEVEALDLSAPATREALGGVADVKVSKSGDTITGALTVTPPGAGRVELVDNTLSVAAVEIFAGDADTEPALAAGSFFGSGAILLGPGGSTAPDSGLIRTGANVIAVGAGAGGVVHATRLRLVRLSSMPSSGTQGDLVNHADAIKLCTVTGTPGTWVTVGP